MGCPRQEYWSGMPSPSPGDLKAIVGYNTSPLIVYNGEDEFTARLSFQQFTSIFTRGIFHLEKPLCSSIRSNSSSWKFYHEMAEIRSLLPAPLLILLLWLFPPHLQLLPPLKSWNPQTNLWGWEYTSYLLLMLILWSHPMNHKCISWHLEWWILFRKLSI